MLKKFVGDNKPSRRKGLYIRKAKLLIIGTRTREAGKYPVPTPIRSEAYSPGKSQTADTAS